jgi:FkbM family methyltransferase
MSLPSRIRTLLQQLRLAPSDPDDFLRRSTGVIHVGANIGQEAPDYDRHHLPVLWIEPIPHIFDELVANIRAYPRQRALKALLMESPMDSVTLNISSNHGASSSVLDLADHRRIWPEVHYVQTLEMPATTLDLLLADQPDIRQYNTLVMDTQGTELRILQGAVVTLAHVDFVKTEVADFESYSGCCRLTEMDEFLASQGFTRIASKPFASLDGVGTYFDVLYARKSFRR